jgi:flagellin
MGMRINTNIDAFDAQRNLSMIGTQYSASVQKLSSGLRINSAADDAAGLSISEKLKAQVSGLSQAQRNAQDGISMIQTGEGALNETHSMLQRMRELAVQAGNGTLSTSDQTAIYQELNQLTQQVDASGNQTQFNSLKLLNGSLTTTVSSGSGVTQGQTLAGGAVVSTLDVSNATAGHTYSFTASGSNLTLTDTTTNAQQTIAVSNLAGGQENLNFSTLGVNLTLSGTENAATIAANLATAATVLTAGTGSVQFQVGANATDTLNVAFGDMRSANIGNAGVAGYASLNAAVASFNTAIGNGTVATSAGNLIKSIDQAISDVSTQRANFGAYQNRLQHTINNLGVAQENLSASESRIRDTDMASEMVNFTKLGILQQAGQSILTQANSAPQQVLQLLRG